MPIRLKQVNFFSSFKKMDYLTLLIGLISLLLLLYWLVSEKRPENFPPGPRGHPFVGNALQWGVDGHVKALKLAEKYGDIMGIYFGGYKTVVLHDPDDIRECFNQPEFSGRYGFNMFLNENPGVVNEGIVLSYGQKWTDMRRFSLKTLRDFGLGKRSLEANIMQEASELIEELKKKAGEPIDTEILFNSSILNVIWSVIAGTRYSRHDPKLTELIDLVQDFSKSSASPIRLLFFIFPWFLTFSKTFPFLFSSKFDNFRAKLFDFFGEAIDEHRATIQIGSPRDYVDAYLEEAMKATNQNDPNSSFTTANNDFGLKVTMMDFFLAGYDTTSTLLMWTLFLIALHPEVEKKVHEEITSVVGSRMITLDDREKLPYVEATLTEIYRVCSLTPTGLPHAVTQDVTFKGYHLPKNTFVLSNLYAVHNSEKIWGDPKTFRPERFMSENGKSFVRNKNVMVFSVGKRQCLGESLARQELFIFLTNLVQQLKITMPNDEPPHTIEGVSMGFVRPEPHKIILLDRNTL